MRSTGLWALMGAICALSWSSVSSAGARIQRANRSEQLTVRKTVKWSVVSPDRRHRVELGASGRLRLDGHALTSTVRPLAPPVWRADSRALAFLQRTDAGLQLLVVLLDVDPFQPLVWSLPSLADCSCRQVFWIGPQRVGIGEKTLVPRFVVSWTTTVA